MAAARMEKQGKEQESMLEANRASSPKEPLLNVKGVVTVVVCMPDSIRRGKAPFQIRPSSGLTTDVVTLLLSLPPPILWRAAPATGAVTASAEESTQVLAALNVIISTTHMTSACLHQSKGLAKEASVQLIQNN